jgi:hypothetical protein
MAGPKCNHPNTKTNAAMKISPPETGAVRQIADLPLRTARWGMEAVEAVEATQFCGGANGTL